MVSVPENGAGSEEAVGKGEEILEFSPSETLLLDLPVVTETLLPGVLSVLPAGAGLVSPVLPFDQAALDAALQGFLQKLDHVGHTMSESVGGLGPAPWLVVLAAAMTAYEIARRRRQRPQMLVHTLADLFPTGQV